MSSPPGATLLPNGTSVPKRLPWNPERAAERVRARARECESLPLFGSPESPLISVGLGREVQKSPTSLWRRPIATPHQTPDAPRWPISPDSQWLYAPLPSPMATLKSVIASHAAKRLPGGSPSLPSLPGDSPSLPSPAMVDGDDDAVQPGFTPVGPSTPTCMPCSSQTLAASTLEPEQGLSFGERLRLGHEACAKALEDNRALLHEVTAAIEAREALAAKEPGVWDHGLYELTCEQILGEEVWQRASLPLRASLAHEHLMRQIDLKLTKLKGLVSGLVSAVAPTSCSTVPGAYLRWSAPSMQEHVQALDVLIQKLHIESVSYRSFWQNAAQSRASRGQRPIIPKRIVPEVSIPWLGAGPTPERVCLDSPQEARVRRRRLGIRGPWVRKVIAKRKQRSAPPLPAPSPYPKPPTAPRPPVSWTGGTLGCLAPWSMGPEDSWHPQSLAKDPEAQGPRSDATLDLLVAPWGSETQGPPPQALAPSGVGACHSQQ